MRTLGLRRHFLTTGAVLPTLIFIYLLHYLVTQTNNHFSFQQNLNGAEISSGKAVSYSEHSIASRSSATETSKQSCELSLIESDGWFCESDDDWKRRKQIHHTQDKRNRNTDNIAVFLERNWEPTFHCAFEQRIGGVGDGGKWVCDIHKIQTNNSRPLIYSFGSSGEFSFERAIRGVLPNAEIHTFDQEFYRCPSGICIFHQAMIGDGKSRGEKSLNMIIDKLGHRRRQIDMLKMDIEGSEYATWEEFFKHPENMTDGIDNKQSEREMPYIRQILLEIHLEGKENEQLIRLAHRLFELFRFNNYAIFHKEANLNVPRVCSEYAFIRLNPNFFISPQ